MPLSTDFNVSPYFDDYDAAKQYYRILFKPSVAVQARELTQAQSMMQNQIEKFGNKIFKDGAVIEGCDNPITIPNLAYVRVSDAFNANANVFFTDINETYLLVGQTSNVRAVPIVTKAGALLNYPDTNRFYVKYLTTGSNNQTSFANGEVINIYSANQSKLSNTLVVGNLINSINVLSTNATINAVGNGYGIIIDSGIIYHKGFFQVTNKQTIAVRDYDQNVEDYVVGFTTTESIVTDINDDSLLDNALGYSNENAPGASRLKLVPTVVAKPRTSIANNDTFFSIFEFSNVTKDVVINKAKTPWDDLADTMNERTYSESGNYVTKPFLTTTIEGPNTAAFSYQVSSGKGFILGSEIEYLAARKVDVDKAMTTSSANQQIITANYGKYVYVNEYAGALNFGGFVTVDLYDNTGFQAITNKFTPSFTGKIKIGTAKVKAVLFDEGDPGLPATTYRIYLSDIAMTSGKSFNSDAKSLYANSSVNTFGDFYADLVLTSSKATINESGKSNLVFPFGKKALKTLRGTNGSYNGTNFYFRTSETATVLVNGLVNISNGSSYTGGTDSIAYSTGVLGDVLENQFNIVFTANASTANVTGNTVSITSGCTHVVGVNLNTFFSNGEFIRITETPSVNNYYRVVSANNTKLVLGSAPTNSNTASVFGKHFPAGYAVPLDNGTYPGTREVNVTSSTTFTVNTGIAAVANLTANSTCVIQYRKIRTTAVQAKKDVKKDRFVKLYANAAVNNAWNLGLPDVFKLKRVYANSAGFSNTDSDEITTHFLLDSGQRDDFYDHGRLVLKPQYNGTLTNQYLTVVVDHFTANLNSGIGFFSVDSYPVDDANTANTNAIVTAQIPLFSSSAGILDLRDAVDFRGVKANTANSSTTLAGATLNPGTTTTFITTSTYLAEPETNFQAAIEYYLGRTDIVTMNKTGGLSVLQGVPSESPKTPVSDIDAMTLAIGYVPPYPSLSFTEASVYNRKDYTVKIQLATNRGYTMKDIGLLEQRLQRLEYYTTLNMLEQKAQNMQVADAAGYNRFKNGIFADPMNSHALAQADDLEYRYSIDKDFGYGRPLFASENIDMEFSDSLSSGVQVTGRIVTRPYTHEKLIYQPFATKIRNNAQDMWSWKGSLNLYPRYDMNRDETIVPASDITIDLTQPFLELANTIAEATGATIFGTRYGDYRTTGSSGTYVTGRSGPYTFYENDTYQERKVSNTFIVPMSNTYPMGKSVTDVAVQAYMKSRTISFIARNLKPNTKVYAFFDDTPVSQYCAPATLDTTVGATLEEAITAAGKTGNPENFLKQTAVPGTALVTDDKGNLFARFTIPSSQFLCGDRQLQIVDVNSLITGADAYLTRAAATFTASNIAVSTQQRSITTITPDIQQTSFQDKRTVISTWYTEPIAQSLSIEAPEGQSGLYVTKLDLFFAKKDPSVGISVFFCPMSNGIPDSSKILGSAHLDSADVVADPTAILPTTFYFKEPIFVNANSDYAFFVAADGNSPEFQMWVSETGYPDVVTGAQVYTNPYCGDLFRSSNAKTWTALPKEDVKFNLYVANFTVGTGTAVFENENDDFITYNTLALANSQVTIAVGDEVFLINSASNVAITNTSVTGAVQSIDTTNGKLKIDSSTGGFSNGAKIGVFRVAQYGNTTQANTTTLVATANVVTVDNAVLHAIVPRFSTGMPLGTTISFSFSGISNSGSLDSTYYDLSLDVEREMLDYSRLVYSKSNQGVSKSLTIKSLLTTNNKYLSPMLDLSRKSALALKNIINSDNTNEHTRYGNSLAKYISQPIVLADGQESEDLKVYLSAYRPINTEIEVYVRFLNNEDSTALTSKTWTKFVNENDELRSSPINRFDFKDFTFNAPTSAPATYAAFRNASNYNVLEYTDSSGVVYRTYKTFAIKIVLLSTDGTFVPKVDDVRAIALQV
jgi:hypothetical protein